MKRVDVFVAIALSAIILDACGSTLTTDTATSAVNEEAAEDASIEQEHTVQPDTTAVSTGTDNSDGDDSGEEHSSIQTNDIENNNKDNSIESSVSETDTASSIIEKIPQDDPVRQAYLEQQNNNEDEYSAPTVEHTSVNENGVTELSVIYPDNEAINKYLNAYNAVNDTTISSEDVSTYYSHGKYYDYVITLKGHNTTISNLEDEIKIHYLRSTLDEYKEDLIRYLKAFDASLDNEAINNVWDQLSEARSEEKVYINDLEVFQTSSPFRRKGDDVDFSSITIEGPTTSNDT